MKTGSAGFYSAVIYTIIALAISGLFFTVTSMRGYDWVARIGGAAWVFMLCMIVLMPIVTPIVKKRMGE